MLSEGFLILLICLGLGLIGHNRLIVACCLALIVLKLARLDGVLRWLTGAGTNLGIFLLILALLAPVAQEQIPLGRFVSELLTRRGAIALVLAAAGAWLGRLGVEHLRASPQALVGLVVGSIAGTIFLGGIPTGPLILAGMTALLASAVGGKV